MMPGMELKEFLKEMIPLTPPEKCTEGDSVHGFDELFAANGDFRALVYDSCLNYAVRRLITMGKYLRRECEALKQDESYFIKKLRRKISEIMKVNDAALRERLCVIITECVAASNRRINQSKVERIKRKALQSGKVCYICGRELDQGKPKDLPQVDHIWPHALGGDNRDDNLAVACERCNQIKKDHINSSDYHYERVASWVLGPHDDSFSNAFDTARRMAVWSKGSWRCAVCGKATEDSGPMVLERITEDDHWHYMNMQTVCSMHAIKKGLTND